MREKDLLRLSLHEDLEDVLFRVAPTRKRERERESVCVCVCVREREGSKRKRLLRASGGGRRGRVAPILLHIRCAVPPLPEIGRERERECVCMCVCVCSCSCLFVCVCVCERERLSECERKGLGLASTL